VQVMDRPLATSHLGIVFIALSNLLLSPMARSNPETCAVNIGSLQLQSFEQTLWSTQCLTPTQFLLRGGSGAVEANDVESSASAADQSKSAHTLNMIEIQMEQTTVSSPAKASSGRGTNFREGSFVPKIPPDDSLIKQKMDDITAVYPGPQITSKILDPGALTAPSVIYNETGNTSAPASDDGRLDPSVIAKIAAAPAHKPGPRAGRAASPRRERMRAAQKPPPARPLGGAAARGKSGGQREQRRCGWSEGCSRQASYGEADGASPGASADGADHGPPSMSLPPVMFCAEHRQVCRRRRHRHSADMQCPPRQIGCTP
jgi:hypothetical protein